MIVDPFGIVGNKNMPFTPSYGAYLAWLTSGTAARCQRLYPHRFHYPISCEFEKCQEEVKSALYRDCLDEPRGRRKPHAPLNFFQLLQRGNPHLFHRSGL